MFLVNSESVVLWISLLKLAVLTRLYSTTKEDLMWCLQVYSLSQENDII